MIRIETLRKLAHEILDADHQTNAGAKPEEISERITKFFATDPDVVGTENEGDHTGYYEALREMFFQTAQQLDEIYERNNPDNHTPMF